MTDVSTSVPNPTEKTVCIDCVEFDFRLLEIDCELDALEDYLQIIETHIESLTKAERTRLETYVRQNHVSSDDPEWYTAVNECEHQIEVFLPRFFRGPFLVMLYAVYESAVTEIAQLIKGKQVQQIFLDDFRGDFLKRAKKYYEHVLKFQLYTGNSAWQSIQMLSTLRHAIAHENGRMEMINSDAKKKIHNWEGQKIGVAVCGGYLVFEARFAANIFQIVRASLKDLIKRYKEWDENITRQALREKDTTKTGRR